MPSPFSLTNPTGPKSWLRRLAVAGLVILLLLAGVYDQLLLALFAEAAQTFAGALQGSTTVIARSSPPPEALHRPSLAFVGYTVLYVGLCLLLLRLLLPQRSHWQLALRVYGGVVLAYAALLVITKLGGNLQWAYRLGRYLLYFIVSPLPVLVLVALLRGPQLACQAEAPR